jgi:hypothetical protein
MNFDQTEYWWPLNCTDEIKLLFTVKNLTHDFTQNFTCEMKGEIFMLHRHNIKNFIIEVSQLILALLVHIDKSVISSYLLCEEQLLFVAALPQDCSTVLCTDWEMSYLCEHGPVWTERSQVSHSYHCEWNHM